MTLFPGELNKEQSFVCDFFTNVFKSSKLANSYLFLGSAKDDKYLVAKAISKHLNCETNNSCGICTNCKWIDSDTHPAALIYLQPSAESKKGIITVEQVKNLQSELSKSSSYYRVVVLTDASFQTLNKHSANALLKVLEEPSENTLFVLFAESEEMVMPTLISRSQTVKFAAKESLEYSEESQELFKEYEIRLHTRNRLEAIELAEELSKNDTKLLMEFLEQYQNKQVALMKNAEDLSFARKINSIERAKRDLKSFLRPKAALEEMLIS